MNFCDQKAFFSISKQYAIYENKGQAAEKKKQETNQKHVEEEK